MLRILSAILFILAGAFILIGLGLFLGMNYCLEQQTDANTWCIRVQHIVNWTVSWRGMLAAGIYLITLLVVTIAKTQKDVSPEGERTNTFISALPFASFTFLLVAVYLLYDVGQSGSLGVPQQMCKLGQGLVAAVVTAVLVLYGTHLTLFEHQINKLHRATTDNVEKMRRQAEGMQAVTNHVSELATSYGQSLVAAMSLGRLREDVFRRGMMDVRVDPYLDATANHVVAAFEATRREHRSMLSDDQQIVARGMMANYLTEEAFDHSRRCLVTNAQNYTGFLIGAARGFERVAETKDVARVRVVYLTHTLVAPANLLNWPWPVKNDSNENTGMDCRAVDFMLEYMTYCRYFASRHDRFIHGRVIRCQPDGPNPTPTYIADPLIPVQSAVERPQDMGLPHLCNRWLVPAWLGCRVAGKQQYYYPGSQLSNRPPFARLPISPQSRDELFIAYQKNRPRAVDPNCGAVYWPVLHSESGRDGAEPPNVRQLTRSLRDKLNRGSTFRTSLLDPDLLQRGDMAGIVEGTWRRFAEQVVDAISNEAVTPELRSHALITALEDLKSIKWAIARGAEPLWTELSLALYTLTNYYLASDALAGEDQNEYANFTSCFADTFHTAPSFAWRRVKNRETERQTFGEINLDEEFAFIALAEFDEDCLANNADSEPEHLRSCLLKIVDPAQSNLECGCHISELLFTRSSMPYPWKHAEIGWQWLVGDPHNPNDEVELRARLRYYIESMQEANNYGIVQ